MKSMMIAAAATVLATALAAPAHADPDTDFAQELHGYGIYGQRDYNAWLGKIVCERLDKGVDSDADASTRFIFPNLPRGSTQAQSWQFLGAAITMYCPDQRAVFEQAADQHR